MNSQQHQYLHLTLSIETSIYCHLVRHLRKGKKDVIKKFLDRAKQNKKIGKQFFILKTFKKTLLKKGEKI